MSITVITGGYAPPPISEKEILRYAGCKRDADEATLSLMRECLAEAEKVLEYKICYAHAEVGVNTIDCTVGPLSVRSAHLAKNLSGAHEAVIFAATVGAKLDRLIAKYMRISPSRALMLQAIGAERIESLCDFFNDDIKKEKKALGKFTHPRFSPGYGDLPIEIQKDIFRALDCPRKIGLTLNENLLMSPTKSVSAIIGIGNS